MHFIKALALSSAVLVGTPLAAQEVAIDRNFQYRSLGWDSGRGATILIWRPVIIDGKVAICGGDGSEGGNVFRNLTRQALRNLRIDGPNGTLIRNLRFFAALSPGDLSPARTSGTAQCRVTGTAATPADLLSYKIGFTRQGYRTD